MKRIFLTLSIIAVFFAFMGVQIQGKTDKEKAKLISENKKILIVYFSHTGNTREIAKQIKKSVGADIFEIQAVKTYSEDYEEVKKQASQELQSGEKPVLKTKLDNIKQYDIIFIGYPIWWGTFPAPVKTFLSEYNLSGKIIVPFCTHLGSGLGGSVSDIKKLCPKSTILDGLAIWGNDVKDAQKKVSEWLGKIKVITLIIRTI